MNETNRLAARIAATDFASIPPAAVEVSKQAILDFIGVTIAGMEEPLARILREEAAEQGGHPQATVIGTNERTSVTQAALINGSAGHAHDYDDVQMVMTGHPTVPVAPVVLAMAEHKGYSGAEVIAAFCAGVDTECIVSTYAGESHYRDGFHSTGTIGSFGATAAAAALMALDKEKISGAFGIAGTQAAGLKASFGTMCKPLHAGHAAATGAQAAALAARDFTARTDILEAEQGFGETQSTGTDGDKFTAALEQASYTQDICFKYHAACYLTHSAIEATSNLCARNAFDPNEIESITVRVDKGHLRVCNIAEPKTGLEAKFSLRFTVAMALTGTDTSSIEAFTDELTQDPELLRFRDKVTVVAHDTPLRETIVTIVTNDGQTHEEAFNVAIPSRNLEQQRDKLERKFRALVAPRLGNDTTEQIIGMCRNLDEMDDLKPLFNTLTRN